MKKNCNTAIVSRDLVLVPYKEEHVPIYHEWMKSPFLQGTTMSSQLNRVSDLYINNFDSHRNDCLGTIITPRRIRNATILVPRQRQMHLYSPLPVLHPKPYRHIKQFRRNDRRY